MNQIVYQPVIKFKSPVIYTPENGCKSPDRLEKRRWFSQQILRGIACRIGLGE
jgi:hypothetical protein